MQHIGGEPDSREKLGTWSAKGLMSSQQLCRESNLLCCCDRFIQPGEEQLVAHGQDDRTNEQADKPHCDESTDGAKEDDNDGNTDAAPQ